MNIHEKLIFFPHVSCKIYCLSGSAQDLKFILPELCSRFRKLAVFPPKAGRSKW